MDIDWIKSQKQQMEKHFSSCHHNSKEIEREKMLAELYKQKGVQFDDFIAFRRQGKQENSLLDQEKIRALEMENKELKRQLAFKVLTYK